MQPEELWNKSILLGREEREMGTEYKTAAHPSCCIPVHAVFAGGHSKAGKGLWGQQEHSSSGEGTEGSRGTAVNLRKLSGTVVGKGVEALLNHPGVEQRRFAWWFSSMLVSVCSFSVANSDCYPLWETWSWAAGVCLGGDFGGSLASISTL